MMCALALHSISGIKPMPGAWDCSYSSCWNTKWILSMQPHSITYRVGVLKVTVQSKQIEMPALVLLWLPQKRTSAEHFWNQVSVKGRKQQSSLCSSETAVKLAATFPRPVVANLPFSSPSSSFASFCLLSESSSQVLELIWFEYH